MLKLALENLKKLPRRVLHHGGALIPDGAPGPGCTDPAALPSNLADGGQPLDSLPAKLHVGCPLQLEWTELVRSFFFLLCFGSFAAFLKAVAGIVQRLTSRFPATVDFVRALAWCELPKQSQGNWNVLALMWLALWPWTHAARQETSRSLLPPGSDLCFSG